MKREELEKKRLARAQDLAHRAKVGDLPPAFDTTATWWPPRPIIVKNKKEIQRIYGDDLEAEPKPASRLSIVR